MYANGEQVDALCPDDLAARGLTAIDLSHGWVPKLFVDDPSLGDIGRLRYRDTLVALAAERFEQLPPGDRANRDRYLELYGITPTFHVLYKRLADHERHACHSEIDNAPLGQLEKELDAWRSLPKQRGDRWTAKTLLERLEFGVKEQGLSSIDALRDDSRYGVTYAGYQRVARRVAAIAAAQRHLNCDGLLDKYEEQVIDYRTKDALDLYLRRHAVVSWTIDKEVAQVMATDSRVLSFRAVLRALRERVVDATGLLEDGSASGELGTVMGQRLDSEAFFKHLGNAPLPNGAPDRISRATEAAAEALGWRTPGEAEAFLAQHLQELDSLRVAVRLPPGPSYHSKHMELRAEIDRGEVWYEYPYTGQGNSRLPTAEQRPTVVLYAKDGDAEVALMRWGTTIGGWKPEVIGTGLVKMIYKESPVGPRVWRDLMVTPRWIPPASTPKRDLMRPTLNGWQLKRDLMGPSYASAYGLVMLIHHRIDQVPDGETIYTDQGIRTHGSVSYDSIHKGTSHGCHRLHNQRAVRLGSFLLRHRDHKRVGSTPLNYVRSFVWRGERKRLDFETRGHRFELTPPVAVDVTRGEIKGQYTRPQHASAPLPVNLARRLGTNR